MGQLNHKVAHKHQMEGRFVWETPIRGHLVILEKLHRHLKKAITRRMPGDLGGRGHHLNGQPVGDMLTFDGKHLVYH